MNGDTTKEHYYGFFWAGMPDLNFDNPEVRKEIYKIGRFWLEEIGVDRFRLNAAKHIFPDVRAADNSTGCTTYSFYCPIKLLQNEVSS